MRCQKEFLHFILKDTIVRSSGIFLLIDNSLFYDSRHHSKRLTLSPKKLKINNYQFDYRKYIDIFLFFLFLNYLLGP